jgi:UDP-N-acetylmuramate dehydrogenase
MVNVKSISTNKLSSYRTLHHFEKYAEFTSLDEFCKYCEWAKQHKAKVYILGNGSNTFFTKKSIKTLILKNKLPKNIQPLTDFRVEISSSVLVIDVLKYCQEQRWDSFYYLASVPATIGGALAMNAGRGRQHECTIYDFVESITFFEDGCVKTLANHEIERSYRQTMFTGVHERIILSSVLKFNALTSEDNLLLDRLKWSKEIQDHSAPNCGTVFKSAYSPIMTILKGLHFGQASFSPKTGNWILNKSESTIPIITLILVAKILHFLTLKKIELEIITID